MDCRLLLCLTIFGLVSHQSLADFHHVQQASCQGNCNRGYINGCYCDEYCTEFGDCCPDYAAYCDGTGPSDYSWYSSSESYYSWGSPSDIDFSWSSSSVIYEDPCNSAPCLNGADCYPFGGDTYFCSCTEGFVGQYCEIALYDPCLSAPCQNGGLCIDDGSCICNYGFIGDFCEIAIDPCLSAPCQNGGVCFDGSCTCNAGFIGEFCEIEIDPCSSDPCQNGGLCSDDGSCICQFGFTGDFCEIVVETINV